MHDMRMYVRTCPSRLGMSRCHACGIRNLECHVVTMTRARTTQRVTGIGGRRHVLYTCMSLVYAAGRQAFLLLL